MNVPGYETLARILRGAYDQAARGKGSERHARPGERFEDQKIIVIPQMLGDENSYGPRYQAIKKLLEAGRLPPARAIQELYGAINYIAGAIYREEQKL